jgi:hypothetical protein
LTLPVKGLSWYVSSETEAVYLKFFEKVGSVVIERRQYERSDLKYFARVYNRKLGRLIGYLVNITPVGVMIVSEKPIDPGAEVGLQIEFSDDRESTMHLNLDAKCVWSRLDNDSVFFELGFKLSDIKGNEAESIAKIVRRYGL